MTIPRIMQNSSKIVIGLIFVCGVSACFSRAPEELPSQEVIRRAIFRMATLDTVNIEALVHIAPQDNLGEKTTLVLTGTIAPLSHAWNIDLGATFHRSGTKDLHTKMMVVSQKPNEIFMKCMEEQQSNCVLTGTNGNWLQLPSSSTAVAHGTPDPRVIDAYANALQILGGGLEQTVDGLYVYRYTVHVDSEILMKSSSDVKMAVQGELTIDARSYDVLTEDWKIKNMPLKDQFLDAVISIRFYDQNRARFTIPALTGSILVKKSILDIFSAL